MVKKETTKVRTTNLLVIIVERLVIPQMFAREKMQIRTLKRNSWVTIISEKIKDIKNMNARIAQQAHKDFKVIVTTVRSMDMEHMSADPSLTGHQTTKLR